MDDNSKKKPSTKRGPALNMTVIMIIVFAIFAVRMLFPGAASTQDEISYSKFLELVDSGSVDNVEISGEQINIALDSKADAKDVEAILVSDSKTDLPKDFLTKNYYTVQMNDPTLIGRLEKNKVEFKQSIIQTSILSSIFISLLPVLLMIALYYFLFKSIMRRAGNEGGMFGGMGGVGKSKAKVYGIEEKTGVDFNNVAGQDEAKESLAEMVDYLNDPGKYSKIGAKQPKGALLVGPPGTGKTLLAKAVAGEAGVPFFHITGSEFVEMFVGVGASRVRDLFQNASKSAPCIIFIDEIDAIGKKRDSQLGGNDEREQTLNQLLSEMDGFESGKGILVLAATNRPEILDKALLRPGRFDRRIIVGLPDLSGRESILKVHASKVTIGPDVDFSEIALATAGATGADLANMINEAALYAVKMGRHSVTQNDLMEAVEVIIAGKEKKSSVMSSMERRLVAYHEIGHALVSVKQKNSQPVQKITIVPRTMGSLGYTMNAPEEDRYLLTKNELLAQIVTLLGGRAAEIVEFNDASTGASNDIERATDMARKMITQYGMSEKFGSMGLESTQNQYLDGRNVATCSEPTGALIDEEVRIMIDSCQKEAVRILEENRTALTNAAEKLLEQENMTGKQFMEIVEESSAA